MKTGILLSVFALVAHAGCGPDESSGADASPAPADATVNLGTPGALLGSYEMTYYWLAFEDDHSGAKVEELFTENCTLLATVSADFADALRLEGSGKLSDGRVLNFEGSCACDNSPCFTAVPESAPWGLGVQNRELQPFRSIAVDTGQFSIGQAVYIEELDGLQMPGDAPVGQFRHDGCVLADDIGGAIVGNHIDFFAGLREHYLTVNALIGSPNVTVREGGERCP